MTETRMLVNYVAGEDCRLAVVEDGKLEEFHSESTKAVSRVGNIYVGKVTNVEAGIQAAFVDFGVEDNGFLHVSDLHPQYFPGEDDETTERVGKKVPRRSRPPIQACLKRGQEIIVQVLKEGIGTKGPTLTSYLSIPGRFLVMMPQMDKVGVSRKVEDDDLRRRMREILDQLDLPEGFGFILRTAGFDRTKTELKRDLAYLQRLWKDMERRRAKGNKPRLLYSESDLLVRSLRDLLASDVKEVVIDSEAALRRAARFMKIVAPRTQARLVHYRGNTPIFHAFGVEQQIAEIHAREVDLPSGGRIVIDETEALVAIDVNSGKMRSAKDAETTAYKTNVEAVDVICRQLRLRDLGGLVINDLIDMRSAAHRKDIEHRFRERLRRDRAKSTILPISNFGILEMTRQRMRGSHESVHFATCPGCRGRGVVQRPDSVAADALRELTAILDHDRVHRVELVVSPRVAGALLSTRRASLTRVELMSGKQMDVRVSETLPADRVSFYAYDESGADIDMEKLPRHARRPELAEWVDESAPEEGWAVDPAEEAEEAAAIQLSEAMAKAQQTEEDAGDLGALELGVDEQEEDKPKRKRRRRRRGKRKGEDGEGVTDAPEQAESAAEDKPDETEQTSEAAAEGEGGEAPKKKRRRRRRRKSGSGEAETQAESQPEAASRAEPPGQSDPDASALSPTDAERSGEDGAATDADDDGKPRKKRRSRRRRKSGVESPDGAEQPAPSDNGEAEPTGSPAKKKTSRRRRSASGATERSGADGAPAQDRAAQTDASAASVDKPDVTVKPPRRGLYAAARRKLSPSEIAKLGLE